MTNFRHSTRPYAVNRGLVFAEKLNDNPLNPSRQLPCRDRLFSKGEWSVLLEGHRPAYGEGGGRCLGRTHPHGYGDPSAAFAPAHFAQDDRFYWAL